MICLTGILLFAGCHPEARRISFDRYHANDDSFSELTLLTNIYCASDADVDQVESLWKRRSSIVLSPIWFLAAPAIERLGANSFRWIDLSSTQVNAIVFRGRLDRGIPAEVIWFEMISYRLDEEDAAG